jgi:hypothetical protein
MKKIQIRINIPDDFFSILNPGSSNNKKENFLLDFLPIFCSHKFHKIVNYIIFEQVQRKTFEPIDREIEYFLPNDHNDQALIA